MSTFSILDKLDYCNNKECVENLVDEYLKSLIMPKENNPKFKLFQEENTVDERIVTNSYFFTRALLQKILFSDIDLNLILQDLENKLGDTHPVIVFLRQFKDQ